MYNAGTKDPDKSLYLQSDTCITHVTACGINLPNALLVIQQPNYSSNP